MAKKKSKRFIIPSFHFLTTSSVPKSSPVPQKVATPQRPIPVKPTETENTKITEKPSGLEPTAPKPIVKPKPLDLRQTGRRNSALSLSSLKRNKEEEASFKKKQEQSKQMKDLPKDPFTEVTFLEVWNSYVDDLHLKGEKILASILKADTPQLKGYMIHVAYPNEMMKVELLKVRPRVLRYIREKLNNYDVDFEITVNEDNTKRFAYTPQEKYELLREKNEALALLRKKFNLDL
jgi:DNA polymerase-3 subunit gamma/tau